MVHGANGLGGYEFDFEDTKTALRKEKAWDFVYQDVYKRQVFSMSGAPSFAWEDAQLSKDQGLSAEFAGRKATDSNAATPSAASKRQAEIPLDDTVTKLEAGKTYTISLSLIHI